MVTKDTNTNTIKSAKSRPNEIEVPGIGKHVHGEAESDPSLLTSMSSFSKSVSASFLTTPTASFLSVSSLERTEVTSPESDGVSGDVMEPEDLVNVDILVEKVTNITLENHDPIPVCVTISDRHNFGDMDAERAQSLARRSATLMVSRFALVGGLDGGGRGQAAVVVDFEGVRRVVTAKHVLAKKRKGDDEM